jgi:hypothetical protein
VEKFAVFKFRVIILKLYHEDRSNKHIGKGGNNVRYTLQNILKSLR